MIDRLRRRERVAGEAAGSPVTDVVGEDFEQADALEEEWDESQTDGEPSPENFSRTQLSTISPWSAF
jgi:hypothetical protein